MIGERKKVSEAFSVANLDYFEELIKKRLKKSTEKNRELKRQTESRSKFSYFLKILNQ